ncbi:MAG: response regulator, partial [Burkholderiaceae bacterium]
MTIINHILMVEDDQAIRTMLRSMLELHDFKVSEAESRLDAIEKLHANQNISVVILDLGLPPNAHDITEGIATLKAIQAEIMAVKVIVLTGQDQEAAALEAIREGAFDFLAKPAASESILNAV